MREGAVYRQIRQQIKRELDYSAASISDEELMAGIERELFRREESRLSPIWELQTVARRIFHSFRGLDVLQDLIDDRSISEIMVNHYQEIFIERAGRIERCDLAFESAERLEDIIQRIVGKVNRSVNEANPIVDARLSDGSRVHVVLPPVSLKGPTLTIRKFMERPPSLEELTEWGTLAYDAAAVLRQAVADRRNLFICGGTGSGKTTLLNALAATIPPEERVITIEDSAELQLPSIPNLVRLETRNANTEGKGEIRIRDLIRASLRMRPNRIIVGEVRGPEALDMLQAMNTGHNGSISTGHANTIPDMFNRLEMMVASAADLPVQVIQKQIASAIEMMVFMTRDRQMNRVVAEICSVKGIRDGQWILETLYSSRGVDEPNDAA